MQGKTKSGGLDSHLVIKDSTSEEQPFVVLLVKSNDSQWEQQRGEPLWLHLLFESQY